ncbi:hypothetical protein [Chryseobacterium sp. SIMBA_029]|uniref:hypothetical protein n=1 Tax=Chryseobacterium sp. SIMBA_029 TaxID=3085772 RepID=UPI0039787311
MKYFEKIQGLLPLGYLYLIILGLLKESIFFYPLGIHILKFSSITDILISPISDITSNPILIILITFIFLAFFIYQAVLIKNSHKEWGKKILKSYRLNADVDKKELQKAMIPVFGVIVAFALLSLFVGLGIGQGKMVKNKLEKQSFKNNYVVTFNSGKTTEIYIIDNNSSYYFYAEKGSKTVKIVPTGNISSLEVINQK